MTLRVGLTGGIGSGKSTVASVFKSCDIPVIDLDHIAHQLTALNGVALPKIRLVFGADVFEQNDSLSRSKLRTLVFNDPCSKKKLEAILHPLLFQEALKQYEEHAKNASIVIFDIPLLTSGSLWLEHLDRILVIDCSETTQIKRVIERSGWEERQIRQVITQQPSREERLSIATDIIENDGIAMAELEKQVIKLLKRWPNNNL